MRWCDWRDGERRVRSGFLWVPRSDYRQRRWLEKARWEEEYQADLGGYWRTLRWLDA